MIPISVVDARITDTLKNTITWRDCETLSGTVVIDPERTDRFQKEKLTWTIGDMQPGAIASLIIYIETLPNPSGKYEPTSGDEGDEQNIEINARAHPQQTGGATTTPTPIEDNITNHTTPRHEQ